MPRDPAPLARQVGRRSARRAVVRDALAKRGAAKHQ